MNMLDRINQEMADAMRARNHTKLGPLRMLKTALVNRRVEARHELDEDEAQRVAFSLVKQHRDSIDQFSRAGRADLVEKETAELAVLSSYLPPPIDAAELDNVIQATIAEIGASSMKDMGRVMKTVMPQLSGKAVDGAAVSELVRRKLGA